MPTCRIAPPCCFRKNRALAIKSADPAKIEPTGAPSPFEKQTLTVSKRAAYSASLTPLAKEAFHSRAPSRCNAKPCPRAVLCDRLDLLQRPDAATAAVVGVLDADQAWWREVIILRRERGL